MSHKRAVGLGARLKVRWILRLTTCTFLPMCRSPSAQQLGGRNFSAPMGGLFATCLVLLPLGPPGDVAAEGTWAWGLSPPWHRAAQLGVTVRSHLPRASPCKDEAPLAASSLAPQSIKGLWVLRWVLGDKAKGPPSPASWRRGAKFGANASRWDGCGPAPKPQQLLSALV